MFLFIIFSCFRLLSVWYGNVHISIMKHDIQWFVSVKPPIKLGCWCQHSLLYYICCELSDNITKLTVERTLYIYTYVYMQDLVTNQQCTTCLHVMSSNTHWRRYAEYIALATKQYELKAHVKLNRKNVLNESSGKAVRGSTDFNQFVYQRVKLLTTVTVARCSDRPSQREQKNTLKQTINHNA